MDNKEDKLRRYLLENEEIIALLFSFYSLDSCQSNHH